MAGLLLEFVGIQRVVFHAAFCDRRNMTRVWILLDCWIMIQKFSTVQGWLILYWPHIQDSISAFLIFKFSMISEISASILEFIAKIIRQQKTRDTFEFSND